MIRKRIVLADGSRLLREMLHRVIDKADHLEVVQELRGLEELPSTMARFDPEWVILAASYNRAVHNWLSTCMAANPAVRFIFLSPESNSIKMKWHTSCEEDLMNLSLKDLISILEKDLQHT